MSKHEVRCIKRCWRSKLPQRFNIGQVDEIESLDPVAMYFEGWPPGTEVYHKIRGTKDKPVKITTRIIPGVKPVMTEGAPEEDSADLATPDAAPDDAQADLATPDLTCDICGTFIGKNEKSLAAHKKGCAERIAATLE